MNLELTENQRKALRMAPEAPLRLIDPETQREYVLLTAAVYETVCSFLEDGLDMRQVGALINDNMREYDVGDPLLDGYQQFRP